MKVPCADSCVQVHIVNYRLHLHGFADCWLPLPAQIVDNLMLKVQLSNNSLPAKRHTEMCTCQPVASLQCQTHKCLFLYPAELPCCLKASSYHLVHVKVRTSARCMPAPGQCCGHILRPWTTILGNLSVANCMWSSHSGTSLKLLLSVDDGCLNCVSVCYSIKQMSCHY